MSFPKDLLDQSRHLLEKERRKPKQASLRRAVSTAYYALFHLLIEEAARNWKGPGSNTDRQKQRTTLARMFEHDRMLKACKQKRDDLSKELKGTPPTDPTLLPKRKLLQIARTFVTIQEDRHSADYDGAKKWTKTETQQKVDLVSQAFANWKDIRDVLESQLFLVSLLLKDRK